MSTRYIDRGQGTPEERARQHEARARELERRRGATCAFAAINHRKQAAKLRKAVRP